jgi:hypothetical protein
MKTEMTLKPGQKRGGRKKGSKNRVGVLVKDAIIMAAEARGFDGKGKEGLVGYMKWLARVEPKAFANLLGRVIPLHVTGSVQHEHREIRSRDEIIAELHERGLPVANVFTRALPPPDYAKLS